VQAVDDGRDLQRQDAAAAAEDPFAVDAVAVVDAVADRADVALLPVGGDERVPEEAVPDPVDAEVRERLRFGELVRDDRLGVPGAAAGRGRAGGDGGSRS
jgi:hypothetical protein